MMMNLYEIMMKHYAPKDSQMGIYTYLVANSDEEVYEWLKSEQELKDGRIIFNSYQDSEKDKETFEIYDNDYKVIGTETFKERMIRLKGDLNDEDVELSDLFYGKTLLGWKVIKKSVTIEDIQTLKDLGICLQSFNKDVI